VLVEGADQDLVVPENIDLPAGGNDLKTGSRQLIMIMKILEKCIGLRNVVTVGVFLPETPVHSLPTQPTQTEVIFPNTSLLQNNFNCW
jgi:hypothetical protein